MPLSIRQRYKPFSHQLGVKIPLPGTSFVFTIYPTKLFVGEDIVPLKIEGPVKAFTALLDLERGDIVVFGEGKSGFFRYYIEKLGDTFQVVEKRQAIKQLPQTRLSFGCNKEQNWDRVLERRSLEEILPIWFQLSGFVEPVTASKSNTLFQKAKEVVEQKKRGEVYQALLELFLTGFDSLLVPVSKDLKWQGYELDPFAQGSQKELLGMCQDLIKSLFVEERGEIIEILPAIPHEFKVGRILNLETKDLTVDLEWTKGFMRQMIIKPKVNKSYHFAFPKEVKSIRFQGKRHSAVEPLDLHEGSVYILDRFE